MQTKDFCFDWLWRAYIVKREWEINSSLLLELYLFIKVAHLYRLTQGKSAIEDIVWPVEYFLHEKKQAPCSYNKLWVSLQADGVENKDNLHCVAQTQTENSLFSD